MNTNSMDHDRTDLTPRVGFLVIGRKRPGFDTDWAQRMEAAATAAVGRCPFDIFQPKSRAVDDATLRAAVEEIRRAACDTILVLQPAMGDGRLAAPLSQLFPGPVVFWATPERPDGGKVSSCSLVGVHAFGSLFRQLGHPFELVYGDPDEQTTVESLAVSIRICHAAAGLRSAKVGLVGGHAPGFVNMLADPALLARSLGVAHHHVGLAEFFELVENRDDAAVRADVGRIESLDLPRDERVTTDDFAADARYYLAMRALMEEESLDALAVRCWPEAPNRFGRWPYLAMARLANEGRVVAMEGDVDGAVSLLIAKLLGFGPAFLSDWLEHDARSIVLWHPGHAPFELCLADSLRLGCHFNNGLPLVVDGVLTPDEPITLFRLWSCDGRYRMTALDARTALPKRELLGTNGLAILDDRDARDWFDSLCHAGMPHHVIVASGHRTSMLRRLARQLQVSWVD